MLLGELVAKKPMPACPHLVVVVFHLDPAATPQVEQARPLSLHLYNKWFPLAQWDTYHYLSLHSVNLGKLHAKSLLDAQKFQGYLLPYTVVRTIGFVEYLFVQLSATCSTRLNLPRQHQLVLIQLDLI